MRTKAQRRSKPNGRSKNEKTWYFLRLAFLAIPWGQRKNPRAAGRLYKNNYLIEATTIDAAFRKADHILSVAESLTGSGRINGRRIIFKGMGILNLEPLYQTLESGVEIFDEHEGKLSLRAASKQVISKQKRLKMIQYEIENGSPPLLEVYWGEEFDDL